MMGKRRPRRTESRRDRSDRSESRREKHKHSHREPTPKVNRHGSYLSDYMKPQIIRRNEDGETMEEEDEFSFDADDTRGVTYDKGLLTPQNLWLFVDQA